MIMLNNRRYAARSAGLKIVLRIGGSILGSPPDGEVMASYATIVEKVLKKGHKVTIVVGGGLVARQYIEAAKKYGAGAQRPGLGRHTGLKTERQAGRDEARVPGSPDHDRHGALEGRQRRTWS